MNDAVDQNSLDRLGRVEQTGETNQLNYLDL